MRKIFQTLALLFIAFTVKAQSGDSEFKINPNGLIYSDQDISALRFVVDSLNLRFKSCDLNKKFHAYPQAKAYSLSFSDKKNNLKEILKSMDAGMDYAALLKQYKAYVESVDSNLLVVKLPKNKKEKQNYLSGNASKGFDTEYILEDVKDIKAGKYYYKYYPKGEYSEDYSISCFYVLENYVRPVLPDEYAKLIQYVDCMIDTSAKIFLGRESDNIFSRGSTDQNLIKELNDYVNKKMGLKKIKDNYDYDYLTDEKLKFTCDSLSSDPYVIENVNDILEWCEKNGQSSDAAETLIASFISKEKALNLKRHRRVYGMCSQDQSPRIHAKNIAMLSAETHSWDIFLRSHLDIMNDRFERASDGSYAWGSRQTYLKELEVLDIEVLDLMFGLSLRSDNLSDNHYFGTVWRIGKALVDSKDRALFEEKVKRFMKDEKLDEFNRTIMFLLYNTYLNYLTDDKEREMKISQMRSTATEYPVFIQNAIVKLEAEKKKKK